MKLTETELAEILQYRTPYVKHFVRTLNELIGDVYNIRFILQKPGEKLNEDTTGIDKRTALILLGDERSQHFPEKLFAAAGVVIKDYCPESWARRGCIPVTCTQMSWTPNGNETPLQPCSSRPYPVMFSANLNFRRTDIFRGVSGRSFMYPFRISSNYPTTGSYPLWHKVEAVLMHKIISRCCERMDYSELYPGSYIRFNAGFNKGGLTNDEYLRRLSLSKISWCTAGFMTNETSRLLESCDAGCAVICGKLPDHDFYRDAPFVQIHDWRKVRTVTDELLKDEARLDEIGAACRQWHLDHFAPDILAKYVARRIGVIV